MKMKIEMFKSRRGELERLPYDSAEFESMAKAREIAFAEGKRSGADHILIASVRSPLVRERWIPDREQWKRFKPRQRPIGDPVQPERPPRQWHYEFAHKTLPMILFAQSDASLSALEDPEQARDLVIATMKLVAVDCRLSSAESKAIADGIKIHSEIFLPSGGVNPVRIFVVEMPPPLKPPECHFAAITMTLDGNMQYFTLERTDSLCTTMETVLGGWDAGGGHLNFGEGSAPNIGSFVSRIGGHLARKRYS